MLNVITGTGSECGLPLARHPLVRKLSFTGSLGIGKSIKEAASERIVPVTLELGGKSPQIVFPDANDDHLVQSVINGMRFTRQGQSCTAGSRLFLHTSIFDSFMDKLVKKLSALKIGDPLDETTDMGAIINRNQFEKVCAYVKDGLDQKGSRLAMGGLPPEEGPLTQGYFMEPTIFTHIKNEWRIAKEEVFGPVLVSIPWEREEEAIRMANDSHYGLAAYVYSHDIGKALRTAHAIESGWVQVNQGLGIVPGGILLSYEVTRLSRNCSDWYPLLDICGFKNCLIADRDGIYDPGSPNGRLLLGLKGQLSEMELHTIRSRMTAGLLNKAARGELALRLPIGLVRDASGQVRKDPDLEAILFS